MAKRSRGRKVDINRVMKEKRGKYDKGEGTRKRKLNREKGNMEIGND